MKALLERRLPGETCVVDGRAAHALLSTGSQQSKLLSSRLFANLGQGTSRNVTVMRALAAKWG